MDSFTVAPELKGTKGDIIAARIEVPIFVVMIYGIVEFIRLGWSQDYYLYTYAPVLGGAVFPVEEVKCSKTHVGYFLFAKNKALIECGVQRLRNVRSRKSGRGCTSPSDRPAAIYRFTLSR
jgi:hypothetical protein